MYFPTQFVVLLLLYPRNHLVLSTNLLLAKHSHYSLTNFILLCMKLYLYNVTGHSSTRPRLWQVAAGLVLPGFKGLIILNGKELPFYHQLLLRNMTRIFTKVVVFLLFDCLVCSECLFPFSSAVEECRAFVNALLSFCDKPFINITNKHVFHCMLFISPSVNIFLDH